MGIRQMVVATLFVAVALGGGCGRTQRATPSANVPLTVWVVLGNSESIGDRSNEGCRLTLAEIQAHIDSLKKSAPDIYGPVIFQWQPSQLRTIRDSLLLPTLFGRPERLLTGANGFDQVIALNYEPDTINIYFAGNIRKVSGVRSPLATTRDPFQAIHSGHAMELPFILVNDGGKQRESGFDVELSPPELVSYHLIEHEMCHYLARFEGRTFGAREYDLEEHVTPGSDQNNLLRAVVPPALPLEVPGGHHKAGTEREEIWYRVAAGNWNNP